MSIIFSSNISFLKAVYLKKLVKKIVLKVSRSEKKFDFLIIQNPWKCISTSSVKRNTLVFGMFRLF